MTATFKPITEQHGCDGKEAESGPSAYAIHLAVGGCLKIARAAWRLPAKVAVSAVDLQVHGYVTG